MRKMLMLLSSLAMIATTVVVLAGAPADAYCKGRESPRWQDFGSFGDETAVSGTCDNDGQHRGAAAEGSPYRPDGKCAVVRSWSRSTGSTWQGYSCRNDSNWVNYFWRPRDTWGSIKMCKGWNAGNCSFSVNSSGM